LHSFCRSLGGLLQRRHNSMTAHVTWGVAGMDVPSVAHQTVGYTIHMPEWIALQCLNNLVPAVCPSSMSVGVHPPTIYVQKWPGWGSAGCHACILRPMYVHRPCGAPPTSVPPSLCAGGAGGMWRPGLPLRSCDPFRPAGVTLVH